MSNETKENKENKPKEREESKEKTESEDSDESSNVKIPGKFKDLVASIEKMSVLDLNELVKILEKKFGVSASVAVVAGNTAVSGDDKEEKSVFTLELSDAGAQKIAVIKVVKEITGFGLKEAKDLVDAVPSVIKEGLKKEEAEELKKKFEEAGGKVTLK